MRKLQKNWQKIQHFMPKIPKLQSNHYKSLAALEGKQDSNFHPM
jgi:hypothetical protein